MSLLKQFHNEQIQKTAIQKEYTNISGITFSKLLESFVINNLIADYKRNPSENGYVWDNQLFNNGIIVETDNNPFVDSNYKLIITGTKDTIDNVDYLLKINNVIYEGHDPEDIFIKIEYHDELNPILWKSEVNKDGEYELQDDVLDALQEAADVYIEFMDMPKLKIEDITLTGSSCNYNWTTKSDIDLHVLVDVKATENEYGKLVEQYFNAQRKVWNELHDIKIKNIPVEFYVQNIAEKHYSTGIYSIQDQEWVEKPSKTRPQLEFDEIASKATRLMDEIDLLLKSCNKPAPVEAMMTKLGTMRKAGLESGGEWSSDNYTYKVLRNDGYLDKLAECKTKLIDRELSVEEEELFKKDDPWEDIGYTKKSKENLPVNNIDNKKTRINLNVPYNQRDTAKRMGARWDAGIRKWYLMVSNSELHKIPNAWR